MKKLWLPLLLGAVIAPNLGQAQPPSPSLITNALVPEAQCRTTNDVTICKGDYMPVCVMPYFYWVIFMGLHPTTNYPSATVWVLMSNSVNGPYGTSKNGVAFNSMLSLYSVDCLKMTSKVIQTSIYTGRYMTGNLLDTEKASPEQDGYATPGSMIELVRYFTCRIAEANNKK